MRELRTLFPLARPYRWGIAAGLLFVLVANVFRIAAPELIGMAIDALGRPGANPRIVLGFAALIVLSTLLRGAALFGMRQLLNGISRRIETDLRAKCFDHLLRLDAGFYGRNRTGDLMSRVTNDTQTVRNAIGPAIMYLAETLVLTAFAVPMMLRTSAPLTLFAVLPLTLLAPAMYLFGRVILRQAERVQDQLGVVSTMVQENLSGARIVRAYVQEEAQEREFEGLNVEYFSRNMALARTTAIFHPLLTFLPGVATVIVFWLGGRAILGGEITLGDFVKFGFYLNFLVWPMMALGWVNNMFQRGAAAMGRINVILRTDPALVLPPQPRTLPVVQGEIEFQEVRFRYPGSERDVLHGLSFRVPAGSTVALVGPTGSGKSTVAALIARLYDPTEGEVRLDGVPLQQLSLDQARAAVGLVPQDAFLFSETLRENIGFGIASDDQRDMRVIEAARVARIDDAIRAFPQAYETRLGERGVNLSGGQRQRATLARALARDPRILILDDSLSAVDTHTEMEILEGLRDVLRKRTALIISHRVTAVMNADLILVLDEGRIVEQGKHTDLLAADGLYASLLHRQILAEELDSDGDALAATPVGA